MPATATRKVAIVDLGSNTSRLVVFEFEAGQWFRLRDSIREPIRLGAGLAADGRLSATAIDRAVAAMTLFADFASGAGLPHPHVLCTSAVREAENGEELLARLRPLELPLEVLPGEEEARLGVVAVANGFALDDAWVIDMGGGSAQLSRMEGRQFAAGRSYPLGAVPLTETFLRSDPPSAGEIAELEAFIASQLGPLLDSIASSDDELVAMGGTVRNLARAAQVETSYPLDLLHNYELGREAFEELTGRLLAMPASRRAEELDINPDRADLLAAGAVLFRSIFRRTGRSSLRISGYGVREGAFFRWFLPLPHLLGDVTRFAVQNVAQQYSQTSPHVARVRRIAQRLFEELKPLHRLGDRDRDLLDAAATLHDIGTTVDYHRHHKHGAYLALTQPLPGFDHREQALVSLLIRYHRKGTPGTGPYRSLMRPDDKTRLTQLAACLRLAEHLECARTGRIHGISARILDDRVLLRARSSGQAVVEIWEARKQADLFEAAFGRRLEIEGLTESLPASRRSLIV
jgi:exopolyphosphatase/guanosine-5'-triphosphate,3'-diphosphate pyrophosphatase